MTVITCDSIFKRFSIFFPCIHCLFSDLLYRSQDPSRTILVLFNYSAKECKPNWISVLSWLRKNVFSVERCFRLSFKVNLFTLTNFHILIPKKEIARFPRSKKSISAELDDVMHELENQRHTCSNLEKKQRSFDKQLQEERMVTTQRTEERDQAQARERAAEAKVRFALSHF